MPGTTVSPLGPIPSSLAAVSNPAPLRSLRRLAHGLRRLRGDSPRRASRDRSTARSTPRLTVRHVRSRLGTHRQSRRHGRDAPAADVPTVGWRMAARQLAQSVDPRLAGPIDVYAAALLVDPDLW